MRLQPWKVGSISCIPEKRYPNSIWGFINSSLLVLIQRTHTIPVANGTNESTVTRIETVQLLLSANVLKPLNALLDEYERSAA